MTNRVILSIGSNDGDAEMIFARAISELFNNDNVTMVRSTRRVWTEPFASKGITSESPKFLNALLAINTTLDYIAFDHFLKEVETHLGASSEAKRQGRVVVDIDILSYDGERHHPDDWNREYIQALIQEL